VNHRVEFKINPDGGLHPEERYARLRDVAGGTLSDGRGFRNEARLNVAYERLGPGQPAGALPSAGRRAG